MPERNVIIRSVNLVSKTSICPFYQPIMTNVIFHKSWKSAPFLRCSEAHCEAAKPMSNAKR